MTEQFAIGLIPCRGVMKRHSVFKMKYQRTRPNIPSNMSEFPWNLKIPFLPAAACLNITSIAAILLSRHVDIGIPLLLKSDAVIDRHSAQRGKYRTSTIKSVER